MNKDALGFQKFIWNAAILWYVHCMQSVLSAYCVQGTVPGVTGSMNWAAPAHWSSQTSRQLLQNVNNDNAIQAVTKDVQRTSSSPMFLHVTSTPHQWPCHHVHSYIYHRRGPNWTPYRHHPCEQRRFSYDSRKDTKLPGFLSLDVDFPTEMYAFFLTWPLLFLDE